MSSWLLPRPRLLGILLLWFRVQQYFDLFSTLDALGLHICKQTSIREQGRGKSNYTHNSIFTGEMNCGMCGGQLTVWPGLVSFSPDLLCRLYQLPHCPLLTAHYHIVFNTTIRASVDALCRDGTSEISRDPRTKRLQTRRESLAMPSKHTDNNF